MGQEQTVSNNKTFRGYSNKLDEIYFRPKDGEHRERQRAFAHGVYHEAIAAGKLLSFNPTGAKAEHDRAMEQFRRVKSPPPIPDDD